MATTKDQDPGPKVFDVARPGSGTQSIGSKPMIVGHKSMASDPMVKETVTSKEKQSPEETPSVDTESDTQVLSKRVIEPLSEEEKQTQESIKDEVIDSEEAPVADPAVDEDPIDQEKVDKPQQTVKKTETKKPTEVVEKKDKEIDPTAQQLELDNNLEKLISSKKYFVNVQESANSGSKTFIVAFIIALIVGLAALAVLIDAEILDLGIKLPFDFL